MYKVKYSQQQVSSVITDLAKKIHVTENTVFLVLMNGGAWFAHELISRLNDMSVRVEYAKVSSYHGKERGQLSINYMPDVDWNGKSVVVLDDICDSGNTLNCIYEWFKQYQIADIRFVTLILRKHRMQLDKGVTLLTGIEDESDDFFVGCGLDDNSFARYLPYIGIVD